MARGKVSLFFFFTVLIAGVSRADPTRIEWSDEPFDTEGRMSRSLLSWAPCGGAQARVEPQCDARTLERGMLAAKSSAGTAAFVREYFKTCGDYIGRGLSSPLISLARASLLREDYRAASAPIDLRFIDSHGFKIRGQLFLKADKRPRPLVIFNGGLQSDIGDPPVTMAMMYLFEEGPFNVLTLGSTTGHDFESDNETLSFGGYQEGRQLIEMARYVRQHKEISSRVSSIHVIGVSLGGHGALYASLFNRYLGEGKLVSSFLAGCPVVNLESSVRQLYTGGGLVGRVAHSRLFEQIGELAHKIPVLGKLIEGRPRREKLYEVLSEQALEVYRDFTRDESLRPYPYQRVWVDRVEKLWDVNNFLKVQHLVQSPTLIFSSANDPVVRTEENTARLAALTNRSAAIQIVPLPKGGHCDLWAAYGWETMGTLWRSWVLSHSPELLSRRRLERRSVAFPPAYTPSRSEFIRYITWEAKRGEDVARLYFSFNRPANSKKNEGSLKFRLEDIGISQKPSNKAQAERLTRFLNRNVFVTGSESGAMKKSEAPRSIEWYRY